MGAGVPPAEGSEGLVLRNAAYRVRVVDASAPMFPMAFNAVGRMTLLGHMTYGLVTGLHYKAIESDDS